VRMYPLTVSTMAFTKFRCRVSIARLWIGHVTLVSVSVCVPGVVRSSMPVAYNVLVVSLVMLYPRVYATGQIEYYITVGTCAVLTHIPLRAKLLFNHKRPQRIAIVEAAALAACLTSAVVVQGKVLGRNLARESKEFDFFHGNWHFLMGTTLSLVYTRSAQAAIREQAQCNAVCAMPQLDGAGMTLIGTYAITVLVLKEARVEIDTAIRIMLTVCVALFVHACATIYFLVRRSVPVWTRYTQSLAELTLVGTHTGVRG